MLLFFFTLLIVFLFLIGVVLFAPIKIGIQSGKNFFFVEFLFFRLVVNTELELQVRFIKKIKISFQTILEKKIQKILRGLFQGKKKEKEPTASKEQVSRKTSKKKKMSFWRVKPHKLELLLLAKRIFSCIFVHKFKLTISWDDCFYLGAFYSVLPLLSNKFKKKLCLSFTLSTSYQVVFGVRLASLFFYLLVWYCRVLTNAKILAVKNRTKK